MRAQARTWAEVLGGGVAALALAGCGGGGGGFAESSAEDIMKAAEKDMKALSALTLQGELKNDGQSLEVDMSVTTAGDCEGSIGTDQGTAEILVVDTTTWLKADPAFWESAAGMPAEQVEQMIGDKWVQLPDGQEGFSDLCDLDELLEDMGEDDGSDAGTVGGTEEVDGQEAVMVDTESEEGDALTAWVAVDDPHHVLKLEVTEGKEPGTLTFSGFDEKPDVKPPADDEVVDLTQAG